ncbi:MAG: hypothetical protein IKK63_09405 [Clostridia bacterium]|nr:hypothetical protein [Clostridia bacterium]MBR3781401.1 hypothetical protein [Clostridia bacterium]
MNKQKFNYDYSKILWMKMFLAKPDYENNTSEVLINFEQALEIIKRIDNITQGIEKIIYLVGWQGLGHDDLYPEMNVINPYLKRDCDATAKDSLLWLVENAKKYNTVISYHGNVADAYKASPTHNEFVKAGAVLKHSDGTAAVIEIFNGRDAYKTSYKQYWESGLFKKIFDDFCEAVPVKEAGTVHLDNFCIAENFFPRTDVEEQNEARNKMLDYVMSLGIDVTSEYTYRELPLRADADHHPVRKYYGLYEKYLPVGEWKNAPMHTLGRIPAVWWMSGMTIDDCINVQPEQFSGYLNDAVLKTVFYGTMHGEDIWMNNGIEKEVWVPLFIKEFCTHHVPYIYLNRYKRLSYKEDDGNYIVSFSDGVESTGKTKSITKNGVVLKQGNDVILPLTEDNKVFVAYSESGKDGEWYIPDAEFEKASVYNITAEGNEYIGDVSVTDEKISLSLKAGQAAAIKRIF